MKVIKDSILLIVSLVTLWPISLLWEWVYRIRRLAYNFGILKREYFGVPIISVGNLTFGGTGKTPFTLWLARYMDSIDKKVLILMRGHKGALEHSHGVLKSGEMFKATAEDFGDEAILLSRRKIKSTIVVGKNRSKNLEYYFDIEKPDVVLLDDGHQHIRLHRSLNIILFDSLMPLTRYRVAPRGYLREGLSALSDADMVVLSRSDHVTRDKICALSDLIKKYTRADILIVEISYVPKGVYDLNYAPYKTYEQLRGMKVMCVAGIASPLSFFRMVELSGAEVVKKLAFPDHHDFRDSEIDSMLGEAKKIGAIILTTEKDIVKLRRPTFEDTIFYLEIDVNFMQSEDLVKERILQVLK
ncbi:MAG: tetraacyldisaccharide 4'-kinase [Bacteriovoracaceae bacterium]|nr:tetraacyldisaccharide 4'-kinase [Bacteriovoracaceae bacterium]